MTVIAWDGKTLAADQQASTNDTRRLSIKIRQLPSGVVIGSTGDQGRGSALELWYEKGARRSCFPSVQKPDEWARLIVATADGVHEYENCPEPMPLLDRYFAWGSGSDFALGAMFAGADAKKAVQAAIAHCTSCGFGVTALQPRRSK
jgi:hypothetical protein